MKVLLNKLINVWRGASKATLALFNVSSYENGSNIPFVESVLLKILPITLRLFGIVVFYAQPASGDVFFQAPLVLVWCNTPRKAIFLNPTVLRSILQQTALLEWRIFWIWPVRGTVYRNDCPKGVTFAKYCGFLTTFLSMQEWRMYGTFKSVLDKRRQQ